MLRSWVEVSLDRVAANYRAVKQTVGAVEVMPVVKADAYRHGASVWRIAWKKRACGGSR